MARIILTICLAGALAPAAAAPALRSVGGLASPESAVQAPDGRIFVSEIGEFGKDGDGRIAVIDAHGKRATFATGLDDPKGLVLRKGVLYVADKTRVMKIDAHGKVSVFARTEAFPQPPLFLNDAAFDAGGTLYVSDTGDLEAGGKGAIFAIRTDGSVALVVSQARNPLIRNPNGLLAERPGTLLIADFATGDVLRMHLGSKRIEKVAGGFGGADGLALDAARMLYISDWKGGRVWKLDLKKPRAAPLEYPHRFQAAADLSLSTDGHYILQPDMKAGALFWLPK